MDSELDENSSGMGSSELDEPETPPPVKSNLSLNLNLKGMKVERGEEKPEKSKVVPKLELKKAKEIQTLIVKKINNDEKKKAGNNVKDEKYRRLEGECEELRRKLGTQIILKLRHEKEANVLKKFVGELEQRNQMLLRAREEKDIEDDYQRERQQH